MNKTEFLNMFHVAKELNSECIFVEIEAVGSKEVIVLPQESFDTKKDFYKGAYNDRLVHVMNDKVKIVGFSHGKHTELINHI